VIFYIESLNQIEIGDKIEVLSDSGMIDNAPWIASVLGRNDNKFRVSYDDGYSQYQFSMSNYSESLKLDNGSIIHIFNK